MFEQDEYKEQGDGEADLPYDIPVEWFIEWGIVLPYPEPFFCYFPNRRVDLVWSAEQ